MSALPPARARTLYALADAWLPPQVGRPGGGDVDVAPGVAASLATLPPGDAQALLRWLALLEQLPRITPRGRHGFAWLPRETRRRWLAACEASAIPQVARATRRWRGLVEAAFAQSSPGAA